MGVSADTASALTRAMSDLGSVDLVFNLTGSAIPADHAYALYSALSRLVPEIHGPDGARGIGIFPIRGPSAGDGKIALSRRPTLRIRTPLAKLPMLLPVAGKRLDLGGCQVCVGVPHVQALDPAATLFSSLVLIKLARPPGQHEVAPQVTPERCLDAARKQLVALGIGGAQVAVPLISSGVRAGQPRRGVLRVKEQTHVGYAMLVRGLTAEESVRLQEQGLGGRRAMGCGLFLPDRQ